MKGTCLQETVLKWTKGRVDILWEFEEAKGYLRALRLRETCVAGLGDPYPGADEDQTDQGARHQEDPYDPW